MKNLHKITSVFLSVLMLVSVFVITSAVTVSANSIVRGIYYDADRNSSIGDNQVAVGTTLHFHLWVDDGDYAIDYATLTVASESHTFDEPGTSYSSIRQSTSISTPGTYTATWTGQWTHGQHFTVSNTFKVKESPGWSVSTSNNVASSQTMTITLKDSVGVSGYYFGTNSNSTSNAYNSVTSGTSVVVTKTISSSGTYYLTTRDIYGNLSTNTPAFTFYKTTLNANGGSVSTNTVLTKKGNSFTPSTPTRSGYTFVGWSTSKTAATGTTSSIMPTSDATYYAIWTDSTIPTCSISSTNNLANLQTVTLSFSDNAGVAGYYWGTSSNYSSNTYTGTSSTSVTKTISSSGTYYLTVKDTSGNVSTTKSITFYSTALNANGGTLASSTSSSVLTARGSSFTPTAPTKSGYSFAGWNTSSTATTGSTSITPTSNSTYYAIWSYNDTTAPTCDISSTNNLANSQTVTLSFSDNAGVAGYYWGTSSNYSSNTYTGTSSTSVTKTISSSGTYYLTVKDTSGNVSTTKSITFYSTALNANGGTLASSTPSSVLTARGSSFTPTAPTKSGCSFAGWNTSSTATTGSTSITPTSNSTYYAIWKANPSVAMVSGVTQTSISENSFTISWNAVLGDSVRYYIEISTNSTNWIDYGCTASTNKTIYNLSAGSNYYVRVRAYVSGVFGAYSNIFKASTMKQTVEVNEPTTNTEPTEAPQTNPAAKKVQKITAKSYKKTYGSKAFSLKAKTSGNGKLTYSSSNKKVVTVSAKGKVTVKGCGKATITIRAAATSKYKSAVKKITVTVKPTKIKITRARGNSKKCTVYFRKHRSISGYECVYNKNKTKQIGPKATSVTLTNLKKGFYIKIRAYKNIGKKKIYGKYVKMTPIFK